MRIRRVVTQQHVGLIFVELEYACTYNTPWIVHAYAEDMDTAIDDAIAAAVSALLNTRYQDVG